MTTGNPDSIAGVAPGKRAALYLRTSTADQHLENQRPELLRIAKQRDLEVVCVYQEQRGAAKQRPALDSMLIDAHSGRFDCLIIWAIDRIGRSMTGNLNLLLELDRVGVRVISAREPWLDNASTIRPLLIGIFGWIAEQEQLRISERTRAGLARARAKGVRVGRPPKELDVAKLRALREAGRSYREIARLVGAGASTIHRLLAADEVLQRAVPKPGLCRIDSKIPKLLDVDRRSFVERKRNNDDGEDEGDVDL
jgi:DNA invertase Pin-like site-specific DNA recombinase